MSGADRSLERRTFLVCCARACTAALALPLLSACASMATRTVTPRAGVLEVPLAQHPELDEAGGALRVQPDDGSDPIYVLAQNDGSLLALSSLCTHLGCTVELQGDRLVCPCHGSTYDRHGRVLQGPADEPLYRYPARVTPDRVLVIQLGRTT